MRILSGIQPSGTLHLGNGAPMADIDNIKQYAKLKPCRSP
jgi:tryptophanyl-tRNA synthetase